MNVVAAFVLLSSFIDVWISLPYGIVFTSHGLPAVLVSAV